MEEIVAALEATYSASSDEVRFTAEQNLKLFLELPEFPLQILTIILSDYPHMIRVSAIIHLGYIINHGLFTKYPQEVILSFMESFIQIFQKIPQDLWPIAMRYFYRLIISALYHNILASPQEAILYLIDNSIDSALILSIALAKYLDIYKNQNQIEKYEGFFMDYFGMLTTIIQGNIEQGIIKLVFKFARILLSIKMQPFFLDHDNTMIWINAALQNEELYYEFFLFLSYIIKYSNVVDIVSAEELIKFIITYSQQTQHFSAVATGLKVIYEAVKKEEYTHIIHNEFIDILTKMYFKIFAVSSEEDCEIIMTKDKIWHDQHYAAKEVLLEILKIHQDLIPFVFNIMQEIIPQSNEMQCFTAFYIASLVTKLITKENESILYDFLSANSHVLEDSSVFRRAGYFIFLNKLKFLELPIDYAVVTLQILCIETSGLVLNYASQSAAILLNKISKPDEKKLIKQIFSNNFSEIINLFLAFAQESDKEYFVISLKKIISFFIDEFSSYALGISINIMNLIINYEDNIRTGLLISILYDIIDIIEGEICQQICHWVVSPIIEIGMHMEDSFALDKIYDLINLITNKSPEFDPIYWEFTKLFMKDDMDDFNFSSISTLLTNFLVRDPGNSLELANFIVNFMEETNDSQIFLQATIVYVQICTLFEEFHIYIDQFYDKFIESLDDDYDQSLYWPFINYMLKTHRLTQHCQEYSLLFDIWLDNLDFPKFVSTFIAIFEKITQEEQELALEKSIECVCKALNWMSEEEDYIIILEPDSKHSSDFSSALSQFYQFCSQFIQQNSKALEFCQIYEHKVTIPK